MWFAVGVGDGSGHAGATRAIEMQNTNTIRRITAAVLSTRQHSVENRGRASSLHSSVSLGSIAILPVCFALQSSVEELLFRGWTFSAISVKFGVVVAVVFSSLVFDLLHFDSHANWIFVTNVFPGTGLPSSNL
jgi:membrane protease YdiL (CAAX protease family)